MFRSDPRGSASGLKDGGHPGVGYHSAALIPGRCLFLKLQWFYLPLIANILAATILEMDSVSFPHFLALSW